MAIVEKKFYGIRCDRCKKILSSDEYGEEYQDNEVWLKYIAKESDWKFARGMHYCPNCYHYDDDDNLVFADGTIISPNDSEWL